MPEALFPLGIIVATPGALAALEEVGLDPRVLLRRHMGGDWGDLDEEDRLLNEQAVHVGTRILSSYTLQDGEQVWVITEADRSGTTLLLPEEY